MKREHSVERADHDRESRRLYGEREISALIKRASELQEEANESPERGVSLEQIERIAAEIGIDPEHLRVAAAELEHGLVPLGEVRFWGGPFLLEQKRVVEGALTEEQWEQIVRELRRLMHVAGTVDQFGRTREWTKAVSDMGLVMEQTQVSISPREDQTTIEVRTHFRGGAYVAYTAGLLLSVTIAGAFLDGAAVSDLMSAVVVGGSGVGGLAAARASIGAWSRRQRRKLKQVIDWLEDTIAHPSSGAEDERLPPGEPLPHERPEPAPAAARTE